MFSKLNVSSSRLRFKPIGPLLVGVFAFLFVASSFLGVSAYSVASVPNIRASNGGVLASINWSGYAVNGTVDSVTRALGSWTVPSVTCPTSGSTYAAFWVGIDGFQSSTVEQTGTDSDCHSGVASYYAWFEFYPKASVTISSITVHPGDVIVALINYSATTSQFTIAIKDKTSGQIFTSSSAVSGAQRDSAEFIVEAPALCISTHCVLTQLSNFGTAGFGVGHTGVAMTSTLTMNGVSGSIGSFPSNQVWPLAMITESAPHVLKDRPSALTNSGTSFTVTWASAGP